ncbi:MATE family efflux transporter [Pararobbsia silviterrae]|uniref:Multidrug-efflux transporter n=1 Tax=Pararobbsia silviterrae TaxID=1792498 RepID=A0A494XVD3_9BURK|nr:MATE family efflux transporter [Pararobbsia silviterrae]RKP54581.1 MATE family efflux transporter [Pararobbsia silviterrae]
MFEHLKRIATLAWPVLIGQLAIIAFGVLDTAMVGRYSALDLASLGLGNSIFISVYLGLSGILIALMPIAGHLFGAGRADEIGHEVRQALWLAAGLSVIGVAVLAWPNALLRLADAPPELAGRTAAYLRILAIGVPAGLVFRVFNSLSTAISRPRMVMTLQLVDLAIKVPLNTWFIFGGFGVPALGGPGSALATTLINYGSAALGLYLIARHAEYRALGVFERFCWPQIKHQIALLKLGVPMGLSYLIEVTSYTFMAIFITHFGTRVLAGHQIAANLGAVLYMTPLSIGIATSTLVSQKLGAREPVQARALGLHGIQLAGVMAVVLTTLVLTLRRQIVSAYTPDASVIAAALPLVTIVAFYHLFDAIQCSTAFALRGYKITTVPTIIYAVALWGVGLGGGYVLGFNVPGTLPAFFTGARGFWFANLASLAIAAVALLVYWLRISHPAHRYASGHPSLQSAEPHVAEPHVAERHVD